MDTRDSLIFTEPLTFSVDFPAGILTEAEKFRQQQRSPLKAEQIYLNTLAVYAVWFYCDCIGIEANLDQGDSWNPTMQTLLNTADLSLANGQLECRPLLPQAEACEVPVEAREDRVGYVVVEVDTENNSAVLLGFSPTANDGWIHRAELQSLDALIDTLMASAALSSADQNSNQRSVQASVAQAATQAEELAATIPAALQTLIGSAEKMSVRLGEWLEGVFEEGWRSPDLLLASSARGLKLPESVLDETITQTRAKSLSIGAVSVVLVVQIEKIAETELSVVLKLYPSAQPTLPEGLRMELIDDSGDIAMETVAAKDDNFVALSFEIETKEAFDVRVVSAQSSVIEPFIS